METTDPSSEGRPHAGRKATWLVPRRGFTVAGQRRVRTGLRFAFDTRANPGGES